jgi:RNA polymerase sigma factor (sigma-70 family)
VEFHPPPRGRPDRRRRYPARRVLRVHPAYRLPDPIEQASAWLFRVARNRIIDRFRKKKEVALEDLAPNHDEDDEYRLDLMLPSPDAGPEAAYTRAMLLEELQRALEDLPANQREVFVAHESGRRQFQGDGRTDRRLDQHFIGRKRYAVLYLRQRLQALYDE